MTPVTVWVIILGGCVHSGEMTQRLIALRSDRVLSPTRNELAVKFGLVLVLRYCAGLVPLSKTELEQISKSWLTAFKETGTFSSNLDSSPVALDHVDGRRKCP